MINSDKVVAWLRTVVPVGWGALVAFLLSRFPALHELLVNPAVTMAVTGLVVAAWYSLWKWLEPRLPAWATVLVLGFDRPPVYFPGEIYDNGYQAGQDDLHVAIGTVAPVLSQEVIDKLKAEWEQARMGSGRTDVPRSISRPGESSGPHAYTDIMPAVPADGTDEHEEPRRDG